MRVALIGNYPPDGQESMLRFGAALHAGLIEQGVEARMIYAEPVVNRLSLTPPTLNKWLGYLDKYLFFTPRLSQHLDWADIVHVCDQANSVYLPHLKHRPNLVTCHDLLAVRAARGEDTACRPSATGRWLQEWILSSLKQAQVVACDSTQTRKDVLRLTGLADEQVKLLHIGLNFPYRVMPPEECRRVLKPLGLDLERPFLLHVGSNEPRKNRAGLLKIFTLVTKSLDCRMIFAGEPLPSELLHLTKELSIADKVISIARPDSQTLQALYNLSLALVYPSLFEGFGWPVIEAQACGCAVVCSNREPLCEISGGAASLCDPMDEAGFAEQIVELAQPARRAHLVQSGLANAALFSTANMISGYIAIYRHLLEDSRSNCRSKSYTASTQ